MKKILISLFIILLSIVAVLIYTYNQELILTNSERAYDNIDMVIKKSIEDEKKEILSIALALSKNKQLKESLLNQNKQLAHKELKDSIEYIKRYSNKDNIYARIIPKDLLIEKPKVEVVYDEAKINIKASIPIYQKSKFLGVLEVMSLLDILVEKLRTYDIEVLIFTNKNLIDLNKIKNKNLIVNKELVLINKNYNKQIFYKLNSLQHKHIKKLFINSFILDEKNFYGVYNIKNSLGKFIVISSKDNLLKFYGNNYSILQNIFNLNSSEEDIFKYIEDYNENEFSIKEINTREYKTLQKNQLKKLTKEELLRLILEDSTKKIIDGKIE